MCVCVYVCQISTGLYIMYFNRSLLAPLYYTRSTRKSFQMLNEFDKAFKLAFFNKFSEFVEKVF